DDAVAWVSRHEADFLAEGFTFATFITRMHSKWISDDISYEYGDILNAPQGTRSFDEYEAIIRSANTALVSFPNIYLSDARLREHLKLHFNSDLRSQYKYVNGADKSLDTIVSYDDDDWCLRVSRIDEAVCERLEQERAAFRRRLNDLNKENEKKRTSASNNTSNYNTNNNNTSSSSNNVNRKFALKLTNDERQLLDANDGCRSCHTLWKGQNHTCEYANKPLPFGMVPTITSQYVKEKRAECNKTLKPSKSANAAKSTTVAAVFGTSSSSDDSSDDSGDSSGSDEFADASSDPHVNEYVFPCHLTWSALACPPSGPPVPVEMLIDHGSPPALMSEAFARTLGLRFRKLREPLKVSGAFPAHSKSASSLEKDIRTLTHYVSMPVSTPCRRWTSNHQLFVVAPRLHSDIILGLDFLAKNRIIVDAADRSAIVKDLDFDLLHPRAVPAFKTAPTLSPPVRRKKLAREIKEGRKL
ncbi:hypothetical protein H0H92_011201, partial [Tricholoma furcatifolium]